MRPRPESERLQPRSDRLRQRRLRSPVTVVTQRSDLQAGRAVGPEGEAVLSSGRPNPFGFGLGIGCTDRSCGVAAEAAIPLLKTLLLLLLRALAYGAERVAPYGPLIGHHLLLKQICRIAVDLRMAK